MALNILDNAEMFNEYKYNEKIFVLRALIDSENAEWCERARDELVKLKDEVSTPEKKYTKMEN